MKASERPIGWVFGGGQTTGRYQTIGRLLVSEFDSLEVIVLLGGQVTSEDFGLRIGLKRVSANTRLKRLYNHGLLSRVERSEHINGKLQRIVHYSLSRTGRRLLAEAFAAMDAACEETAA